MLTAFECQFLSFTSEGTNTTIFVLTIVSYEIRYSAIKNLHEQQIHKWLEKFLFISNNVEKIMTEKQYLNYFEILINERKCLEK